MTMNPLRRRSLSTILLIVAMALCQIEAAADKPARKAPSARNTLVRAIGLYCGTAGQTDEKKARELFNKVAETGDPLARMWVARCFHVGRCRFPKEPERAESEAKVVIADVKRLANKGDSLAMFLLADAFHEGLGVAVDYDQALVWYQKAAAAGDAPAMGNLGIIYKDGLGIAEDYEKALGWLRKAAEAGNSYAMINLEWMYRRGQGVERDDQKALEWYLKAAENGHVATMFRLGLGYHYGNGVPQDDVEAVKWYRKAAEAGHAGAMCNLGYMYARGRGVEKDREEAFRWTSKSAEAGGAQGTFNLGRAYERGDGVEKDLQRAMVLYTKASQLGIENAKRRLERVKEKIADEQQETAEVIEAVGKPEQEIEIDKVAARVKDTACEGVEWLIYEKKFVARVEGTNLQNFAEFLLARDLKEIKVNNLAFSTDSVWAATDIGAFCYKRHTRAWVEYAVNREYIGMPVDSISADAGDVVTFRMKVAGKAKVYTLNTKTSEWAETK